MAAHPNLKTLSQAFNTHFLIRHFLLEVGRSKFKAATIDEPSLWAPEDPSPNTVLNYPQFLAIFTKYICIA
jgi:hypothetical protein